ncbi:solute carrier family 10 (sodium/bile acid cotransporter), member 7 [Arboricoccus pini]|uniref:Solute carrier family 10 (Sodium/bile acid cotransporter), member 7 n=1 Tax=Arboricoccus pini TaxID=1963835 RepID=A0A212QTK0_9PROT|nr:bile acid:sodium symporter family protein [Arboricoccus pini]SNB62959.1 solute carrier family 10 (sodium/bile acid cotransporter), member 7 [Arboricoccus pini]
MRRLLTRLPIDPYLLGLLATVGAAFLFPARDRGAEVADVVTYAAIVLLFFLYGARLSPTNVVQGISHWRLQGFVLLLSFVLFPVLGLILTLALRNVVDGTLLMGLMFVCVLPSTVQSSIAFTSIARGNVAAALCSASVSNLLGVVLTPLLVGLLMNAHGAALSLDSLKDIALQLVAPFAAGQLLRPWINSWLSRHRGILGYVDRGSILLVVYGAFSHGVVSGVWQQVGLEDLGVIILLDSLLLAIVLSASAYLSRRFGFEKEDEIAIVFCGSKKSMASGIPMANILFQGMPVGLIVLPLMLFHQLQLFACAAIARRYASRRPTEETPVAPAQASLRA